MLSYPFEAEPPIGDGSAVTVAPGVLWLRMPLFASLQWINLWAIEDGPGWALIDTGINTPQTIAAWQAALAGPLAGRPVTRVLSTHMHPDHCGLAGWLVARCGVQLWMSQLEYLTCRVMTADTGRSTPHEALEFYRAAGWDAAALAVYQQRFGDFGRMIHPLPDAYRRLTDGERLRFGSRDWQVVVGSGHSPEHACLYCPELEVFISGDQVLPKITSNVSVYPTEPAADPLHDWLTSLARLKARVPDNVLVLPSHNSPFRGLHERCDVLVQSHVGGLARLQEMLATPRRAVDVFAALFNRPITPEILFMATGEALAHLNHLVRTGRARSSPDAAGVRWWQTNGIAV